MATISAVVAAACILASVRRLSIAATPTHWDPREVWGALVGPQAFDSLAVVLNRSREGEWEQAIFAAFAEPDVARRGAVVAELMTEIDGKIAMWSRVPRVCASIATSTGFLCASISLLRSGGAGGTVVPLGDAIGASVDAFSWGITGAAFCGVIQWRAAKAQRESLAAVDRLVGRMHTISSGRVATFAAP